MRKLTLWSLLLALIIPSISFAAVGITEQQASIVISHVAEDGLITTADENILRPATPEAAEQAANHRGETMHVLFFNVAQKDYYIAFRPLAEGPFTLHTPHQPKVHQRQH